MLSRKCRKTTYKSVKRQFQTSCCFPCTNTFPQYYWTSCHFSPAVELIVLIPESDKETCLKIKNRKISKHYDTSSALVLYQPRSSKDLRCHCVMVRFLIGSTFVICVLYFDHPVYNFGRAPAVCPSVCLSDDNYQKTWRGKLIFFSTSGIAPVNTGQVRIGR